jgi:hypothetical protein
MQTWKVPRSSSKVKRLAFDHSYLASSAVAQVLDSIQSLEEFHYSHFTPVRCQIAMRRDPRSHLAVELSWPKVLEALRQHRDSLVDLQLRELPDSQPFPKEGQGGKIGSLADFNKLERLWVDPGNMLDLAAAEIDLAAKLPKSLEVLQLDIWVRAHFSQLYKSVLASLTQSVFTQEKKRLRLWCCTMKGCGLAQMRVSDPVRALTRAGIVVLLDGNSGVTCSHQDRLWTPEQLEEIENFVLEEQSLSVA